MAFAALRSLKAIPLVNQLPAGPYYGILAEFGLAGGPLSRLRAGARRRLHPLGRPHAVPGPRPRAGDGAAALAAALDRPGHGTGGGVARVRACSGGCTPIAYPLVISGKPYFAWPAFMPITFELAVLFAALGAVFGMFALNRLPMHHHPLFQSRVFERVTDDAFFISIESWDPRFDPSATGQLLRVAGRPPRRAGWSAVMMSATSRRAAARAGHDLRRGTRGTRLPR